MSSKISKILEYFVSHSIYTPFPDPILIDPVVFDIDL